ncbi:hypothetical protein M2277_006460 [Paenibacillus sp. LBL]|uniref:hypothetical protein n=1 Tax=Paenibacillus sp. LBL TaxID=2940563 RepID=UPI0024747415|nr:hypothetical protein [Paenibacillus sp. LBL]MDH6675739.1 hypothetical protein [Paenibacillus sp. LBL]
MSHEHLIKELDFVLTHPLCGVKNLENFYNNCLFMYDTVPLIVIVDHIRREKPRLLNEWSEKNEIIQKIITEMEIPKEELVLNQNSNILIMTDLEKEQPSSNGIYKILWTTELDENKVDFCFKRKTLKVQCRKNGNLELVGMKKIELNKYNLYLKMKEELK